MNKLINKTQGIFIYIALITLVSKLLGFFREVFIASTFGANAETDSYVIAVTIVTSFYLVMGDVINNTFVPQYLDLKRDNRLRADRFASSIINIILLATIILLTICGLFTRQIVFLFAPGLYPENMLDAINFTRLLLPTLVITGLSIAVRSILQANSTFIGPALMGIPNHIVVIVYLLFGGIYGVKGLVYATAVGTSVQLLAQLPFIKATGFKYAGLGIYEHKAVKKFTHALGFIIVGSSVNQINTLIDRALASLTGQGNISILDYANKLNLFVAAVFIASITTVIYPKLASIKDQEQLNSKVGEYLRFILIILIPISLVLIYYSFDIVNVLFGWGSFTPKNVTDTARVFTAYTIGIIPFGICELLNRAFYSMGDMRTPMRVGIVAVLANITLNLILVRYIGIVGLALATSTASIIYMIISMKLLNNKTAIFSTKLLRWIFKVFIIIFVIAPVFYITDITLVRYGSASPEYTVIRAATSSIVALFLYGILMHRYGGYNGS